MALLPSCPPDFEGLSWGKWSQSGLLLGVLQSVLHLLTLKRGGLKGQTCQKAITRFPHDFPMLPFGLLRQDGRFVISN